MEATHSPVDTSASCPETISESPQDSSEAFSAVEPVSGAGVVDLAGRVASALTASAQAEASLRALFRSVKFLGASVGAARKTNEALVSELRTLQRLLGERSAAPGERMTAKALEARAHLLEEALGEAAERAVRDREFLIAEHDGFIASLIADHEKELAHLRRRVDEAESRLAARELRDFDFGWDEDGRP